MLGYQESPYIVEAEHEMTIQGARQRFEIRAPNCAPNNAPRERRYISVEYFAANGKLQADQLLNYDAASAAYLDEDWNRLCTEPSLKIGELRYCERIDNHHIGYTRDGGVCMY